MRTMTPAAATLAGVIMVAGCAAGSRGFTPPPATVAPIASIVVQPKDCPPAQPTPLLLYPESPEEAKIAGNLIGCTNGSATYFKNNDSTAVWTMDHPAASRSLAPMAQVFREAMPDDLRRRTLEPGQSAIVNAAPGTVRLSLNVQAQAAWQALSALVDTVRAGGRAEERLKRLLSDDSKSRKAAVACGSDGFKIGAELVESGLSVANGAMGCGKAINEARAERVLIADELNGTLRSNAWRSSTRAMLDIVKHARGIHF